MEEGQPPMEEEQPMEEGQPPMEEEQTNNSFMNNEFKTINTTPHMQNPQQRTQDEDDVFFPDAAETRQKNIMYK